MDKGCRAYLWERACGGEEKHSRQREGKQNYRGHDQLNPSTVSFGYSTGSATVGRSNDAQYNSAAREETRFREAEWDNYLRHGPRGQAEYHHGFEHCI